MVSFEEPWVSGALRTAGLKASAARTLKMGYDQMGWNFQKNAQKKLKFAIKSTFRGQIEVLKDDSRVVFHADLGYERPGSPK